MTMPLLPGPVTEPASLGMVAHAAADAARHAAGAVADAVAEEVHAVRDAAGATAGAVKEEVQAAGRAAQHAGEKLVHSKPVQAVERAVAGAAGLVEDVGSTLLADVEGWAEGKAERIKHAAMSAGEAMRAVAGACKQRCRAAAEALAGVKQPPDTMGPSEAARASVELEECYHQCAEEHHMHEQPPEQLQQQREKEQAVVV